MTGERREEERRERSSGFPVLEVFLILSVVLIVFFAFWYFFVKKEKKEEGPAVSELQPVIAELKKISAKLDKMPQQAPAPVIESKPIVPPKPAAQPTPKQRVTQAPVQRVSGRPNMWSSREECFAVLRDGNYEFYTPKYFSTHGRNPPDGVTKLQIPLEADACVHLWTTAGWQWVKQRRGTVYRFYAVDGRPSRVYARDDCGNAANEIAYLSQAAAPRSDIAPPVAEERVVRRIVRVRVPTEVIVDGYPQQYAQQYVQPQPVYAPQAMYAAPAYSSYGYGAGLPPLNLGLVYAPSDVNITRTVTTTNPPPAVVAPVPPTIITRPATPAPGFITRPATAAPGFITRPAGR